MFRTTKGGDLALFLPNSIDIERITNVMDWKRGFVFRTTKRRDLAHFLPNSIDIELITNIVVSKRGFVFRTTKTGVLTLLFAKYNEFERISFNFDMQAYLEIYTSRIRINEQIVFRSTEGDDLALYLSNSILY